MRTRNLQKLLKFLPWNKGTVVGRFWIVNQEFELLITPQRRILDSVQAIITRSLKLRIMTHTGIYTTREICSLDILILQEYIFKLESLDIQLDIRDST